jgi:putative oxidoreductase
VRVLLGPAVAANGAQKVFGSFGSHGLRGMGDFFETLGFRSAAMFAAMTGPERTDRGLLLVLGLFTPVGATAVLAAVIVAMISVHSNPEPLVARDGAGCNRPNPSL